MDDRERDKFYSGSGAASDDDDYEVEPPDPDVISAEERHGREVAESARMSIDIDEVYREADRNRGAEILEQWVRNFRFRYQTKHLLIATALLAIVFALARLEGFWPAIIILIMFSVGGLYSYLKWEENKQQAEAERKRQELYARRREQLQGKGLPIKGQKVGPRASAPISPDAPPSDDDMWKQVATREPFRLRFSLRTLIVAMTVAAVFFGLVRLLGGPANTATLLGFIAAAGLVIHVLGYDPPQPVILGWWFILVLYVLTSILGAIWLAVA
ncbi:MAG TPA: hypothetical protein VFW73_12455 [Lacipirellulaceae bacterium]|nr:hypothetical protein [Lacipirellulaceae bacterium]